jgi:eukaryotic-like serine/threonine-protein kinase
MKLSTNTKTDIFTHIAIILVCLMALFFAFFFVYLPWSTNHNESIKVPNLKGLSLEAAQGLLDDSDLKYEVSDSIFMPNASPNSVLSNFPKSGLLVKSGRKIYLTLAAFSAPLVKMPNITGRSISSAKNQLLSSGLLYDGEEKISALEENTVLKIKVNGAEVEPGQSVPKGSKVVLLVGDGYGNQMIDVPSVTGMAFDEAEVLLTGLGLKIGNVTYETSDKPEGTVIKQSPQAGGDNKIRNGAPVNVWVSGQGDAPAADTAPDNGNR